MYYNPEDIIMPEALWNASLGNKLAFILVGSISGNSLDDLIRTLFVFQVHEVRLYNFILC